MPDGKFLYIFDDYADRPGLDAWVDYLAASGHDAIVHWIGGTPVISARGTVTDMPMPAHLIEPTGTAFCHGNLELNSRELRPEGTVVSIGPVDIGDGTISVFAGPCAVETQDQLLSTAKVAADAGAVGLRGGVFKPRTSPYSFQGLKLAGLELLAEARSKTSLPILTEIVDPRHIEPFAEVVDGFQIGARNMQNFALLSEIGQAHMPVVLKRGFGCTIDELLAASEYLLAEGSDQVVLCERGIRTFDHATRFTLDLSAVAVIKQRSHLPVMVDPSHAVGARSLVEPMALGAIAVGADALLIDIHVTPADALCDGDQALPPGDFTHLMEKLDLLAMGIGTKLARASDRQSGWLVGHAPAR